MNSNNQKVALVTGGGQGIGKAIADRFLKDGWRVVIAEANAKIGRVTGAELGMNCYFVQTDVGSEAQVKRCVAQGLKQFGRLDLLVNNAGLADPKMKPFDVRAWQRMLTVDLTGPFLFCKYAVPALEKTRGAMINIASTRALMSEPHTEGYAAAKGGLIALTHALAISLGPRVRVNSISPGWIETSRWRPGPETKLRAVDHEQHPVGHVGHPEDIAGMAAYLATAEFVTGQNYIIDGGMTRKMIYAE